MRLRLYQWVLTLGGVALAIFIYAFPEVSFALLRAVGLSSDALRALTLVTLCGLVCVVGGILLHNRRRRKFVAKFPGAREMSDG